jgi:S1-C subfamily serine protease
MKFRHLHYLIILALLLAAVGVAAAQPGRGGERPFVGVSFEAADNGVAITEVAAGSPAETAGLQAGDIITAVDGEAVTVNSFPRLIRGKSVGDEVVFTLTRDGEEQEITVTLGAAPAREDAPFMPGVMQERTYLGVQLTEEDDRLTVAEVVENSPAAEAGLQAGDVITALNGEAVTTAQAFADAIQAMAPDTEITLSVTRGEEALELIATLGATMDLPGMGRMPFGRGGRGIMIVPGQFNYLEDESVWEVGELPEDSPFYEAGLRSGDRITAVNGEINTPDALMELFMNPETETVTLTVQRGDETLEIEVDRSILPMLFVNTLNFDFSIMPDGMPFEGRFGGMMLGAALGADFVQLNEQTATEFNIPQTEGIYVVRVVQGSPAAEAGLLARDIITAINGTAITEDFQLRDLLEGVEPGEALTLTLDVLRDGETQQLELTINLPMIRGFDFDFDFPFPDLPEPDKQGEEEQQSA